MNLDWTATPHSPVAGSAATIENVPNRGDTIDPSNGRGPYYDSVRGRSARRRSSSARICSPVSLASHRSPPR